MVKVFVEMFAFVDACVCLGVHLHTFKLLVISVLCARSLEELKACLFLFPLSGPLALAFM